MKKGLSILMLAYNEEENLKRVIPEVQEALAHVEYEYEILVVDTQVPTDATEEVCRKYGVRYFNQKYPGFGGAFRTGIENIRYDRMLTIDSDGAHPPAAIPAIVKMHDTGDYDVVIGSRYVKGGGTHDPWINVLMSKVLNGTYGIVFGIPAKDISTNFRIYYSEDIIGIPLECINYDVLQEILIKCKIKKGSLRVGETPIVLRERICGESKRQLFKFIKSYISTLIKLRKMERRA
ncbi:MAG: glycosyltransferase family 2 protein [Lachnospiraceae bacterium]|nr:glycosyltransferase family 2 protein [Lachnospiraceae bacterium]